MSDIISIFSFKNGYLEQELVNRKEFSLFIFHFNPKNYQDAGIEDRLVQEFARHKPDILTFGKDPWVTQQLLRRLKNISPKTKFLMYYGDQRGGISPNVRPRIGLLDGLLVNNRDRKQHRAYKDAGIRYVNAYFDGFWEKDFYPIDQQRKYDLIFGGNNFAPKKFPLSKLRKKLILDLYSSFDMVIYGQGWPFKTEKIVRKHLYNLVLQTAKINLGINHFDIGEYYEERIIDCMASGRMHMTYYIPDMENQFKNHHHLVWFKSIDECKELIRYYLKHDAEREKIAQCGRQLMLDKFTFEHYTNWFTKVVNHLLSGVSYG